MNSTPACRPSRMLDFPSLADFVDPFEALLDYTLPLLEQSRSGSSQPGGFSRGMPAVDLYEDDAAYYVRAEVPGFSSKAITIQLENSVLTLSGACEEKSASSTAPKQGGQAPTASSSCSSSCRFSRSILVPEGIQAEQVRASCRDGILTITLPKHEHHRPRQIPVE